MGKLKEDKRAARINRTMKKCAKCNTLKPLAEYFKSAVNLDGHGSYCKACGVVVQAAVRALPGNRERFRLRAKGYYAENKEAINARAKAKREGNKQ